MLTPFTASNLALPGLSHGFFGRTGGVSDGIFASLNCGYGSGDAHERVQENRARVAAHFAQDETRLITLYQIHSAETLSLSAPPAEKCEADAMATRTPGLILGVLTADCAPVLFADPGAGVIGAAHAGWKGAYGGIIESTLSAMERLGADRSRIRAAIGPCIGQKSYEVGPEFIARINEQAPGNEVYFTAPDARGHAFFNLKRYVESRLRQAGLADISVSPADTCAEETLFFSYRRATLRAENGYGRQISCIMLNPVE